MVSFWRRVIGAVSLIIFMVVLIGVKTVPSDIKMSRDTVASTSAVLFFCWMATSATKKILMVINNEDLEFTILPVIAWVGFTVINMVRRWNPIPPDFPVHNWVDLSLLVFLVSWPVIDALDLVYAIWADRQKAHESWCADEIP